MESANFHHQHQLQEQLVGSSSFSTHPSYYGVGSNHAWNPNIFLPIKNALNMKSTSWVLVDHQGSDIHTHKDLLVRWITVRHTENLNLVRNGGYFNPNVSGVLSNSRESRQKIDILVPPLNTSMIQDLGFHWASNAGSFTNDSSDELNLEKIKEELSNSFPKYNEMINCPYNVEGFHLPSTSYIKHEQQGLHDLSEKHLPKTISSINGLQVSAGELYSNAENSSRFGGASSSYRGNFSQIFPTTYISNMNPLSSSFSSSLGMNLQALDLLSSSQRQSNSHLKTPPFTNGVTETKRPSSFSEPKASHAAPKKPRFESRSSSCPLFKVRKEKLGDRIAALQQLVAPYGKTDTASVLMEAIGYIKFLQSQVETLSVPYMKSSSRNKTCSAMHGGSSEDDRNKEPKRDLRSRGLCLVPLSCTSYVTNDYGGVWPPPNFGRGT